MNVIGSPFLFIIYEGKGAVAFRTMLRVCNFIGVDAPGRDFVARALLITARVNREGTILPRHTI